MVVDSNILIDFFRDYSRAREYLLGCEEMLKISRITAMEVILGVKTKQSGGRVVKQVEELGIEVLEVDDEVSREGWNIFWENYHRDGIGILDSLIAATALVQREKLVTRNVRHFRHIKGLDLIVPY